MNSRVLSGAAIAAAVDPEAIALSDHRGAQLTYAGLAEAVRRSAAELARPGSVPVTSYRSSRGTSAAG
jgi:hypothetical protein